MARIPSLNFNLGNAGKPSPFGPSAIPTLRPPPSAARTLLDIGNPRVPSPFLGRTSLPKRPVAGPTAPTAPTTPTAPQPGTASFNAQLEQIRKTAQGISTQLSEKAVTRDAAAAPPPPVVPDETQKAITSAEKAVADASIITAGELTTQADLDRLITSTRTAFTNTENQPIPLEFITGQLSNIESRALDLAEPLESKLARLQAKRTNAVEASKFALERADAAAAAETTAAAQLSKDTESRRQFGLQQGLAQDKFDEDVRQFGLQFASDERERASNVDALNGGGFNDGSFSQEAQQIANLILSDKAKLSDITDKAFRREVMNAMSTTGTSAKEQEIQSLNLVISDIDDILVHKGLNSRVGSTPFARITLGDVTGAGDDFAGFVQELTSEAALNELIAVKARGATFGALQKSEMDLLIRSASKIGGWEIEEDGVPQGSWDIDEASFKRELKRLQGLYQKAISRAVGDSGGGVDPAAAAIGSKVVINGIEYLKTGKDNFEPT